MIHKLNALQDEISRLRKTKDYQALIFAWHKLKGEIKTILNTEDCNLNAFNAKINDIVHCSLLVTTSLFSDNLYAIFTNIIKLNNSISPLLQDNAPFYVVQDDIDKLSIKLSKINLSSTKVLVSEDENRPLHRLCVQLLIIVKDSHALNEHSLDQVQKKLSKISPTLLPVYSHLVCLKKTLDTFIKNKHIPFSFSLAEINQIQDDLNEIDSIRIDGSFIGSSNSEVVSGQALVIEILEACFEEVRELLILKDNDMNGVEDNDLRWIYDKLYLLKEQLERLFVTEKWWAVPGGSSKLEKFLVPIQISLGEIDNKRVDGKFMDSTNSIVPAGQAILHFLLHKCYRLVHVLQTKSEKGAPVNAPLIPVYQQLLTVRNMLAELVKWKVQLSERELIPYQIKLNSVDSLRVGGKFLESGGESDVVPEGQGVLHDLLNEGYALLEQLKETGDDDERGDE